MEKSTETKCQAVDKSYYQVEQDKGVIATRHVAKVPWNLLSTIVHEMDMSSLPNNPTETRNKTGKLLLMKREIQRIKICTSHYGKDGIL